MSMRCANCGSKKVVPVSKKDSFSVGKAVAGNILFGPVGTVMGINGKETQGYYCSTCGATLNNLMPDYLSELIDTAVKSGNKSMVPESCWGIEWESEPNYADSNNPKGINSHNATQQSVSALIAQVVAENRGYMDTIDFELAVSKKLRENGLSDNESTSREILISYMERDGLLCDINGSFVILLKKFLDAPADILEGRRKDVQEHREDKIKEWRNDETLLVSEKMLDQMFDRLSNFRESSHEDLVDAMYAIGTYLDSSERKNELIQKCVNLGMIAVAERNGTKYYRLNK